MERKVGSELKEDVENAARMDQKMAKSELSFDRLKLGKFRTKEAQPQGIRKLKNLKMQKYLEKCSKFATICT